MVSYPNPWFQLRTGTPGVFLPVPVCPVCVPAPPGVFLPVRPRVPCVPCVSRLPPVSFYRYASGTYAPRRAPIISETSTRSAQKAGARPTPCRRRGLRAQTL
jgi:hypothetical protein